MFLTWQFVLRVIFYLCISIDSSGSTDMRPCPTINKPSYLPQYLLNAMLLYYNDHPYPWIASMHSQSSKDRFGGWRMMSACILLVARLSDPHDVGCEQCEWWSETFEP